MPTPKKKAKEKSVLDKLRSLIAPGYYDGQNPIARSIVGHGFRTAKNFDLSLAKITGAPVDSSLFIRAKDPAQEVRQMQSRLGTPERIFNTYWKPRIKLAD
jgi:hypothetical protein